MDSNRFDQLTVLFVKHGTRRGALKALAAAALAAVGLGSRSAAQGIACVNLGSTCSRIGNVLPCCLGATCQNRRCRCDDDHEECEGECVDLSTSSTNCGQCGNVCPGGKSCRNGLCGRPVGCDGDDECEGSEYCEDGACVCSTECCRNQDCPALGNCLQDGTCLCPGECCFGANCAANENCTLVNDTYFCFCKPELVCGPEGNQFCCAADQTCQNGACLSVAGCSVDSDCAPYEVCTSFFGRLACLCKPEHVCGPAGNQVCCIGGTVCQNGSCASSPACSSNSDCPGTAVCQNGSCVTGGSDSGDDDDDDDDEIGGPSECSSNSDCPGIAYCQDGLCVTLRECLFDAQCPGGEVCQDGSCVSGNHIVDSGDVDDHDDSADGGGTGSPPECNGNGDCPGSEVCQDGTCVCLENCCADTDCAANEYCANVNNQFNCFCQPQLVCGPAGNQVCCLANESCMSGTCGTGAGGGGGTGAPPECSGDNDCPQGEYCDLGVCVSGHDGNGGNGGGNDNQPQCTADHHCPQGQVCQLGSCVAGDDDDDDGGGEAGNPPECSGDGDCPGFEVCQSGVCVCPGNCCSDQDCLANQACLNVNNQYNCFCQPDLVCGPAGNEGCCEASQSCVDQTCV